MIKIELVKFEAQDVITVSGGAIEAPAAPACKHSETKLVEHTDPFYHTHNVCKDCETFVFCQYPQCSENQ